jgi:hypothetical protein
VELVFYDKKGNGMNNITWFDSGKIMQGMALIGKTGQIRFKAAFAESMKFKPGERWRVGVNKERTVLYFIKPESGQEFNGFKMMYQNKSWFLSGKTMVNELKLQLPIRGMVEPYKDEKMEGFIMKLPPLETKEAEQKQIQNGIKAE